MSAGPLYKGAPRVGRTAFYSGEHQKLESQELTDELLENVDCVVILVRHGGIDFDRIARLAPLVVDTVNATGRDSDARVFRLGVGRQETSPVTA